MPVYDYMCPDCGPITALRPMSAHADPIACPACKQEAPRVLLQVHHMSGLSAERRTALATNERARHTPQFSTRDSP
ncbi:zinc ribbon domain-containing protein [Breoghania sp.]|uniref:FmdB family zinc ribbon protein n=1 Tax=Breoghania sp. TaxID=2065378 RepID=UPI0032047DA5